MAHLKAGTRIAVSVLSPAGGRTEESATIARTTRVMLPIPDGYHPVRFADGGGVLIHEDDFRVVDNRRSA